MFDVKVQLKIVLGAMSARQTAHGIMQIRLVGGGPGETNEGRWFIVGAADRRLTHLGPGPHRWHWDASLRNRIVLEKAGHHTWAWLDDFPVSPGLGSKGTCWAFNMPIGPWKDGPEGRYIGDWGIVARAEHKNLPDFDPHLTGILALLKRGSRDTGWRYKTSSGWSASAGLVLGGGLAKGQLVLARREANDVRDWRLDYVMAGAGVMKPGIGGNVATESMPSTALTEVRTGPAAPQRALTIDDFVGSVVVVDGSAGVSFLPVKAAGGGAGGGASLFLFCSNFNPGEPFDPTGCKAYFACASVSGGGGKGTGPSAQTLLYFGAATRP